MFNKQIGEESAGLLGEEKWREMKCLGGTQQWGGAFKKSTSVCRNEAAASQRRPEAVIRCDVPGGGAAMTAIRRS